VWLQVYGAHPGSAPRVRQGEDDAGRTRRRRILTGRAYVMQTHDKTRIGDDGPPLQGLAVLQHAPRAERSEDQAAICDSHRCRYPSGVLDLELPLAPTRLLDNVPEFDPGPLLTADDQPDRCFAYE
jgi:hypothetical protein